MSSSPSELIEEFANGRFGSDGQVFGFALEFLRLVMLAGVTLQALQVHASSKKALHMTHTSLWGITLAAGRFGSYSLY